PDVAAKGLDEEHLAARALEPDPRRHDARVVDDDERVPDLVRQIGEPAVADGAGCAVVDEEPRVVPPLERPLRDELGRQVVVERGGLHPARKLPLRRMDEGAIERAKERLSRAAEGRTDPASVEAALERARAGIEALAQTTAEIEATLPGKVEGAVQEGLREQVLPVARHLAEVRGLMAQAIGRLERLEGDLLAERHGRGDDLALLVDL